MPLKQTTKDHILTILYEQLEESESMLDAAKSYSTSGHNLADKINAYRINQLTLKVQELTDMINEINNES